MQIMVVLQNKCFNPSHIAMVTGVRKNGERWGFEVWVTGVNNSFEFYYDTEEEANEMNMLVITKVDIYLRNLLS